MWYNIIDQEVGASIKINDIPSISMTILYYYYIYFLFPHFYGCGNELSII